MQEMPETKIVQEKLVSQQGVASIVPADMPRVVIVGAGFGGLHAARALRNIPVQVTEIDRNNHHLFQPLLYYEYTKKNSTGVRLNERKLPDWEGMWRVSFPLQLYEHYHGNLRRRIVDHHLLI